MRRIALVFSLIGLVLTIIPAFFVFYGAITWKLHSQLMFAGMVIWFLSAPMWMNKEKNAED